MVDQAAVNGAAVDGAATEREAPPAEVEAGDDLAGLRRALDDERKQRRTFERQARELAAARDQAEAGKKSDLERLADQLAKATAERDGLVAAARTREVRDRVTEAAERAGAEYPRDLYKLLADDLEYDDDGMPVNVAKAIDALKKSRPKLFRSVGSADGGARGITGPGGQDFNAMIRDSVRR